jgi:hypothetical protein
MVDRNAGTRPLRLILRIFCLVVVSGVLAVVASSVEADVRAVARVSDAIDAGGAWCC